MMLGMLRAEWDPSPSARSVLLSLPVDSTPESPNLAVLELPCDEAGGRVLCWCWWCWRSPPPPGDDEAVVLIDLVSELIEDAAGVGSEADLSAVVASS